MLRATHTLIRPRSYQPSFVQPYHTRTHTFTYTPIHVHIKYRGNIKTTPHVRVAVVSHPTSRLSFRGRSRRMRTATGLFLGLGACLTPLAVGKKQDHVRRKRGRRREDKGKQAGREGSDMSKVDGDQMCDLPIRASKSYLSPLFLPMHHQAMDFLKMVEAQAAEWEDRKLQLLKSNAGSQGVSILPLLPSPFSCLLPSLLPSFLPFLPFLPCRPLFPPLSSFFFSTGRGSTTIFGLKALTGRCRESGIEQKYPQEEGGRE